jgi:DNA polymerase-3 subunit delta'
LARAVKIEEERPPADALEGALLPRETSVLFGHRGAEQTLLDSYRSLRMHHAWIIAGETGIGRATLAFRLARFLFAHPDPRSPEVGSALDLAVPAEHPAARRVAAGSHPNLLHLQRDWSEKQRRYRSALSVELVRRIIPFLGMTAGEAGWRVVIVDPAEDMTPSAANAILKMLEEPPPRSLFLLVAQSRGGLLPTIVSRCRTLLLEPLTPADTEAAAAAAIKATAGEPEDSVNAALAAGSPRRLIELRRGEARTLYELMLKAIEGGDAEAQLRLSALSAEPAATGRFLFLYGGYLGRRVRGEPEPHFAAQPPAAPLVTWAELWEKAVRSGQEVATYNLDRRQFVLDVLESTAAVLRRSRRRDET